LIEELESASPLGFGDAVLHSPSQASGVGDEPADAFSFQSGKGVVEILPRKKPMSVTVALRYETAVSVDQWLAVKDGAVDISGVVLESFRRRKGQLDERPRLIGRDEPRIDRRKSGDLERPGKRPGVALGSGGNDESDAECAAAHPGQPQGRQNGHRQKKENARPRRHPQSLIKRHVMEEQREQTERGTQGNRHPEKSHHEPEQDVPARAPAAERAGQGQSGKDAHHETGEQGLLLMGKEEVEPREAR